MVWEKKSHTSQRLSSSMNRKNIVDINGVWGEFTNELTVEYVYIVSLGQLGVISTAKINAVIIELMIYSVLLVFVSINMRNW